MRTSLPHTLRERRRSRAEQHKREETRAQDMTSYTPDADVQRVRSAGGPLDQASYACPCGFMFLAPVSTTVVCPHCSAPQAW
jgi:hypothetical protein